MYSDGPETPTITGPNVVMTGDSATLSCNATSTPQSHYVWSFNGSEVSNMSEYVTPPLTKDLSGKYTCMAINNITSINSTAHIMITVVGETWIHIFYVKENVTYKEAEQIAKGCGFCFVSRSNRKCSSTSGNETCRGKLLIYFIVQCERRC